MQFLKEQPHSKRAIPTPTPGHTADYYKRPVSPMQGLCTHSPFFHYGLHFPFKTGIIQVPECGFERRNTKA